MSVGSYRRIRVGLIGYGLGGRVFHAPPIAGVSAPLEIAGGDGAPPRVVLLQG